MDIRILGAHNCESQNSKCISLLIDETIVIDAGGLTSSLPFSAQRKLKAILLTHQHYDHIRDILAVAMNTFLQKTNINIYSIQPVYDIFTTQLFNGNLYPNFLERPQDNPAVKFSVIEPYQTEQIEGYRVMAIPVIHSTPAVGYQVTSPDGSTVFYTGDCGPGLADCWQYISPQLLIAEVTAPDSYEEFALRAGHLTPSLLKHELNTFREVHGYLPRVVVVHMNPLMETEIEAEITTVADALGNTIKLGYEGMQLHL